jgi:hypothetical protein
LCADGCVAAASAPTEGSTAAFFFFTFGPVFAVLGRFRLGTTKEKLEQEQHKLQQQI